MAQSQKDGGRGFDRSYKRGAIMGLTVAEAFILLSFCLLLLFTWWQIDTERKSLFVAEEIGKLTVEEKAAIVAGLSDGTFKAAEVLRKAGVDLTDTSALEDLAQYSQLLRDEEFRKLVEQVAELPPETRQSLIDSRSLEDAAQYSRFIREDDFRRLMEGVVKLSPETRLSLADAVAVNDEVALRALLATTQTEDSTVEQIAGRLETAARQQGALVTLLDGKLGTVIREAGGSIDAKGTITLPQSILFDASGDQIKNPDFLRELCVPWLEALRKSGIDVSDLKIEGHASSEGPVGSTQDQAYLYNLDLSQRRARNALSLCLSAEKDPEAVAWVREHLAAVGYSSARLIYRPDGTEDREASRRVMFSVALNQDGLIDDIKRDVAAPETLMDASGPARVIDGDTVEVQETSFRLAGIDAPEMGQQCRSKAGTLFDCGEVARRGLELAIAGQPIECHATEVDIYKRPVAVCTVGGRDLAATMVVNGYAVPFIQYSDAYVARGEDAKKANVGIWQTDFEMPWDYRKSN